MTPQQRRAFTNHLTQARRFLDSGRFFEAREALRPLAQTIKDEPELLHLLARAELGLYRPDLALPRLVRLTEIVERPPYTLHEDLARAYRMLGRLEDSVLSFERAARLAPGEPGPICRRAMVLEALGREEQAVRALQPLTDKGSRHPLLALALGLLAQTDEQRSEAESQLEEFGSDPKLSDAERSELNAALATLRRERGDHDGAWDAMERANLLAGSDLDTDSHERQLELLIAAWSEEKTAQTLERSSERPDDGSSIALIVGQPASGEHLVEHILACHPEVAAGGTRGDLFRAIAALRDTRTRSADSPNGVLVMTPERLEQVGKRAIEIYGKLLKRGQKITTDSQISHVGSLGTLRAILPGLKIIRCVRDARDACVDAYFDPPGTRPKYAGNLRASGVATRCERRVMEHWKQVLPGESGGIFDVVYEDLVRDPEPVVRALLAYLGLEFDEACLAPEAYAGPPIGSGRGRLRKAIAEHEIGVADTFAAHLGPFDQALAPQASEDPGEDASG
ncbi:MAG: sulfotransferase [Planctomycetota bacterium]